MLTVYTDLAQVPLDTPPPDVGDGGTVTAEKAPVAPTRMAMGAAPPAVLTPEQAAPATQTNLVMPFTREIKFGTGGQDVKGVKRAIWRANDLRLTPFTPVFGPIAQRQLQEFQHRNSLQADGVVGPLTLHKLAPYFDQFAYLLYEGYAPGTNPTQAKRQRALAYLLWGYNARPSIFYLQFRPMSLMNDLEHLPISEDCSTFYTKMAKYGGWPDPNGFGYDGIGNTSSLIAHGRWIELAAAQLGDAIFYSNPAHVGGYVGHDRIISLGSSAGPSLTSVQYRTDFAQARSYL